MTSEAAPTPEPPRLVDMKRFAITINLAALNNNPPHTFCDVIAKVYTAAVTIGGAAVTIQTQTSPLEPGMVRFEVTTDVPEGAPSLMELQHRLFADYICDTHPDGDGANCETCSARMLIALTMPRDTPAVAAPDADEQERQAIRQAILR